MFISFKVLTTNNIHDRESGRRFLQLYMQSFPRHSFQRYGDEEPVRNIFHPKHLEEVVDFWSHVGMMFMAEGRKPRVSFFVHFLSKHSDIHFYRFETDDPNDLAAVQGFLYSAVEGFDADYAVAHILTKAEFEKRRTLLRIRNEIRNQQRRLTIDKNSPTLKSLAQQFRGTEVPPGRVRKPDWPETLWDWTIGNNATPQLEKCLPDLYWISVFGQPYVQMFGREKLLSTPISDVRELSNGAIALRLIDNLDDSAESYEGFEGIRKSCKEHLGMEAFCDPDAPRGRLYRTPKFTFPNSKPRKRPKPPTIN